MSLFLWAGTGQSIEFNVSSIIFQDHKYLAVSLRLWISLGIVIKMFPFTNVTVEDSVYVSI